MPKVLMFCENQQRWFLVDDPKVCPCCPMAEGYDHAIVKPDKIIEGKSEEKEESGD